MSDEKEPQLKSESLTAERPERLVGRAALWADSITDDLPFTVATVSLMEDIQQDCPEVEIRVEQLECLDAIQEARAMGEERALVQMATGLGKTTVLAAEIRRFLADQPDARVLFLCHQNDILAQARERFESIVGSRYTYGNFTGENQDYHEVTCLFASFQAMHGWREAFLKDEFDYVVVDESHHGKATTYEQTLEYFEPQFMLGVTATPDRHDLRNIRDIFGEEIYQLSLEEAIAQGLLAGVDYHVITDDIADTSVLRDIRGMRYNLKQLDRTIFVPKRDEEIVRIISEKSQEVDDPKRIVFCRSIEQAEEYAQYFERAAPLHSRLPKWEQDRYIELFRNGEIDTLLTIDMFNEGIDIPDANQVVFLRSTQSRTIFLQQLGRGLRKAPGKSKVQVLDFVANCDRLVMLDEIWRVIQDYAESSGDMKVADTLRIDTGEIHFSEAARDIIEILNEIESTNSQYRNWGPEDSVAYYRKLCDDLGYVAGTSDIEEARIERRGPSYAVLTKKHFNHRLSVLRKACGIEKPKKSDQWTAVDSAKVYREICGDSPMTLAQLREHLKRNKKLPRVSKLLQPFSGRIRDLQESAGYKVRGRKRHRDLTDWTAEDSISAYLEVSQGMHITARELESRLATSYPDLPSVPSILRPFGGRLANLKAAVDERVSLEGRPRRVSNRTQLQSWKDWSAEDSARVYRELTGDGLPLRVNQLEKILREEHPELPSIATILKPFEGKIGGLLQAAGYKPYRKS